MTICTIPEQVFGWKYFTFDADVIFGLGGNDTITGGSGTDILCGGDGNDTLNGGSGTDTLVGGGGDDQIDAGSGADTVWAGDGLDIVDAGSGADEVHGGSGDDILNGDSGGDLLDGGSGIDTLDGGSGTDTCEPEAGRISCEVDLAPGGQGAETIITRAYDGDRLLTDVTVTNPDGTIDVYALTWDQTLPVPQVVSITENGATTTLVYGVNRAFAVDPGGVATGFEYSVLGDTTAGPLTISSGFDPYGQPDTQNTTVGFGYRGELHIGDLVYLRFRNLDPGLGRFTTTDPLNGLPGTSTIANQFAYAGNDPIRQVDPWGLRPTDDDVGGVDPGRPDVGGVPPRPGPDQAPDWLLDRATEALRGLGAFLDGATGVCGDVTIDAFFSFQAQGCFVDDGDRLGTLAFGVVGAGGGGPFPLLGALSGNLSYVLSNAASIRDLAGDTVCVGVNVAPLVGPSGGVEVCFGLGVGAPFPQTEAEFDTAQNGAITIAASVGVSAGSIVSGRIVFGTVAIGELWNYPFFIPRVIPSPRDLLLGPLAPLLAFTR